MKFLRTMSSSSHSPLPGLSLLLSVLLCLWLWAPPAWASPDPVTDSFKIGADQDFITADRYQNPEDDRQTLVFDPNIRNHTDQFLFRFKPQ